MARSAAGRTAAAEEGAAIAEAAAEANVKGTDGSRQLCEAVGVAAGGTCLLGFSRGKDSIAAWLYLRNFFDRIIPYTCVSIPHLGFVDRSLAYYEKWFGTKIERYWDPAAIRAIAGWEFQPLEDAEAIDGLDYWHYTKHDLEHLLRRKYDCPRAWAAYGINQTDSIDRRIYVGQCRGRNDRRRTFYPTWDWKRCDIMAAIAEAGISLPEDYWLANRSFAGVPNNRHLARMTTQYPEDMRRVEVVFPFIRARLARVEFRRLQAIATGSGVRGHGPAALDAPVV